MSLMEALAKKNKGPGGAVAALTKNIAKTNGSDQSKTALKNALERKMLNAGSSAPNPASNDLPGSSAPTSLPNTPTTKRNALGRKTASNTQDVANSYDAKKAALARLARR